MIEACTCGSLPELEDESHERRAYVCPKCGRKARRCKSVKNARKNWNYEIRKQKAGDNRDKLSKEK